MKGFCKRIKAGHLSAQWQSIWIWLHETLEARDVLGSHPCISLGQTSKCLSQAKERANTPQTTFLTSQETHMKPGVCSLPRVGSHFRLHVAFLRCVFSSTHRRTSARQSCKQQTGIGIVMCRTAACEDTRNVHHVSPQILC